MSTAQQASSLVHQAEMQERREREQALADYIKLITADNGKATDVKALIAAARTIGKSAADMNADRAIIVEALKMIAELDSLAGADTVSIALNEMAVTHSEWTQQQIDALKAQQTQLQALADAASGKQSRHQYVRRQLAAHLASNVPITSLVKMPADNATAPRDAIDLIPEFQAWQKSHRELVEVAIQSPASTPSPVSDPTT